MEGGGDGENGGWVHRGRLMITDGGRTKLFDPERGGVSGGGSGSSWRKKSRKNKGGDASSSTTPAGASQPSATNPTADHIPLTPTTPSPTDAQLPGATSSAH